MSKQLIFKPSSDELDYIYENIDSWTNWCRHNLNRCRNNRRGKLIETIGTRMLLIVSGLTIASLAYISSLYVIVIPCFLVGSLMIIIGSFSTWRILLNERK